MQSIAYQMNEEVATREQRASDLAEVFGSVKKNDDGSFTVMSQWTPGKSYTVKGQACTCPDFCFRGSKCKHIIAAEEYTARALVPVRA